MNRLKDKVAFITGAAGGIGAATAARFVAEGAAVVVADLNGEAAQAVAQKLGSSALPITLDIGDESAFRAALDRTVTHFGRLNILFNNAALTDTESLTRDTTATQIPIDLWTKTLHINLTGFLFGCRHAIPHMAAGGGGSIINMASGSGLAADISRIAYGTSKAGVIALTKYIATQNGAQRIRCNGIAPGPIVTPHSRAVAGKLFDLIQRHTPMGELGTPDDIASLAAFLAADESRYINGEIITIDGGLMAHHAHVSDMRDFLSNAQNESPTGL
jgi:NAD(P)-dependent dehydrogenase (short-subunit alcohol dehydrogenase family)